MPHHPTANPVLFFSTKPGYSYQNGELHYSDLLDSMFWCGKQLHTSFLTQHRVDLQVGLEIYKRKLCLPSLL